MTPDLQAAVTLTYRYRLLPTKCQHQRLREALEHTRQLYNAALEERIGCYRKTGRGLRFHDQSASITVLRRSHPDWAIYAHSMQRWPLKQLDLAFRAFFRRLKAGEKPGYPRFRGAEWFKTFGFMDDDGCRVRNGRLCMKGIGGVRLHLHRPLPSEPTTCKVKREGRHWFALLTVGVGCVPAHDGISVGIDLGLAHLAALSTGETIENPRPYLRAMRELRRRQRALSRCKRGSNGRHKARVRAAAVQARTRRIRDTYLHQVSASLTRRFGLIAIEDLNVKGLAAGILARQVNDAGWGKLIDFIRYKAARAGIELIEVDPRYTSQTCPECGTIAPKALSQRTHECPCGCVLDRDVAAARVILHRAVTGPGFVKPLSAAA